MTGLSLLFLRAFVSRLSFMDAFLLLIPGAAFLEPCSLAWQPLLFSDHDACFFSACWRFLSPYSPPDASLDQYRFHRFGSLRIGPIFSHMLVIYAAVVIVCGFVRRIFRGGTSLSAARSVFPLLQRTVSGDLLKARRVMSSVTQRFPPFSFRR